MCIPGEAHSYRECKELMHSELRDDEITDSNVIIYQITEKYKRNSKQFDNESVSYDIARKHSTYSNMSMGAYEFGTYQIAEFPFWYLSL